MQSIYNLDEFDIQEIFTQFKLAGTYRVRQVVDNIYRKRYGSSSQFTDVKKEVREHFNTNYSFDLPEVSKKFVSQDGTIKLLLKLKDGNYIESVIIPESNRTTLCVSSQVGCAMKCSFCHTGTQGFTRHLETHEIVGQVMIAEKVFESRMSNVVFMGMGEPLHNFENVIKAVKILNEYMDIGKRKITVSTSGLVPEIKKMGEVCNVNLAISLHAVDNETRSVLVPLNKKYNIQSLLKACKEYPLGLHRKITFEYTLIKDVNDSLEVAQKLSDLIRDIPSLVNLIPMNAHPCSPYQPPSFDHCRKFQSVLTNNGLRCTIRDTRGDDILAACGQLKARETAKLVQV